MPRGRVIEVDIHSMEKAQAKSKLFNLIANAPADVMEIVVIHGYNSGTVLRDMVRNELRHSRIRDKMISVINPGITTIFLHTEK